MKIVRRLESDERSYCRSFPAVFKGAKGSRLLDEDELDAGLDAGLDIVENYVGRASNHAETTAMA